MTVLAGLPQVRHHSNLRRTVQQLDHGTHKQFPVESLAGRLSLPSPRLTATNK